jgi:four helix bundle protein
LWSLKKLLHGKRQKELSVSIYKAFEQSMDFGFKDQIQWSVISISNNIAEGYERQTNREFRQCLFIAKGSCAEVCSMLHCGVELGLLEPGKYIILIEQTKEVGKVLSGLIKSLSKSTLP